MRCLIQTARRAVRGEVAICVCGRTGSPIHCIPIIGILIPPHPYIVQLPGHEVVGDVDVATIRVNNRAAYEHRGRVQIILVEPIDGARDRLLCG